MNLVSVDVIESVAWAFLQIQARIVAFPLLCSGSVSAEQLPHTGPVISYVITCLQRSDCRHGQQPGSRLTVSDGKEEGAIYCPEGRVEHRVCEKLHLAGNFTGQLPAFSLTLM